jgi:hypothetical protein
VVRLRKPNEWVPPKGKLGDGETPRYAAAGGIANNRASADKSKPHDNRNATGTICDLFSGNVWSRGPLPLAFVCTASL